MVREIRLKFENKDFKKLQNMKEEWKITGRCKNWEEFIINLSKLVK